MGSFELYETLDINTAEITTSFVAQSLKTSLSKYYKDSDIKIKDDGLSIQGNLSSFWERAVTKADIQIKLFESSVTLQAVGTTSIGTLPWIWLVLGMFSYGFFSIWFLIDLIEYLICRDRPKKYLKDAFLGLKYSALASIKSSVNNEDKRAIVLCPFCKEEIKRDAVVCKHCRSQITTNQA